MSAADPFEELSAAGLIVIGQPRRKETKKPPEGGFFMEGKNSADYFSAALRRPFRVFIGASTTKLLASQDGMLPPGSVCTW